MKNKQYLIRNDNNIIVLLFLDIYCSIYLIQSYNFKWIPIPFLAIKKISSKTYNFFKETNATI